MKKIEDYKTGTLFTSGLATYRFDGLTKNKLRVWLTEINLNAKITESIDVVNTYIKKGRLKQVKHDTNDK